MKPVENGIYEGVVVHKRLAPRRHALKYRVFAFLLDCSELPRLGASLRLFSHNRFNIFSLYGRDHGDAAGLQEYLAKLATRAGCGATVKRFVMLCYPRILGYVFNPLTIYYGLDEQDRIRLLIYEVNNTFGQRQTYVLPVRKGGDEVIAQTCTKSFHVSPFNAADGSYLFRIAHPGETLCAGVALADAQGPVLKAYFRGARRAFSDRELALLLLKHGPMTLKVIAGIHYEALKLWLKGLRVRKRPDAPDRAVAVFHASEEQS